jgi:hypothetical protein
MKLTLDIGRDEELRQEILKLIRTEVRSITGEEIRELVKQQINEQNIPARVVAAFKDLVNAQINMFKSTYGRMAAEDILKAKFQEVVDKNFESFFQKQCIPFLTNHIKNNFANTLNSIQNIMKADKNG